MNSLIELESVNFNYPLPDGGRKRILTGLNFSLYPGEYVAVMGPSGSGKTTFANLIGLLSRMSAGSFKFNGQQLAELSSESIDLIRARNIGFIFQDYILLDHLSVLDNVLLPLHYDDMSSREKRERAMGLIIKLGLEKRVSAYPKTLSGGQKQRVAIARALVRNPKLIVADEPTGALDRQSRHDVLDLLQQIANDGTAVVMITHSEEDATAAGRVVRFSDGRIRSDETQLRHRSFRQGQIKNNFAGAVDLFSELTVSHDVDLIKYLRIAADGVYDAATFSLVMQRLEVKSLNRDDVKEQIFTAWNKYPTELRNELIPLFFAAGQSAVAVYDELIESQLNSMSLPEFERAINKLVDSTVYLESRFFNTTMLSTHKSERIRALFLRALRVWRKIDQFSAAIDELLVDRDSRVRADALRIKLEAGMSYDEFKQRLDKKELTPREVGLKMGCLLRDPTLEGELTEFLKERAQKADLREVKSILYSLARWQSAQNQNEPSRRTSEFLKALFTERPEYFRYREELASLVKRAQKDELSKRRRRDDRQEMQKLG